MNEYLFEDLLIYPQQFKNEIIQYKTNKTLKAIQDLSQNNKQLNNQFEILNSAEVFKQSQNLFWKYKNKNRYSELVPYVHNLIKCPQIDDFYLNLSLMRSVIDQRIYSAFTQYPLPSTVEHFWYAIFKLNVKKIFMICNRGVFQFIVNIIFINLYICLSCSIHFNFNILNTKIQHISNQYWPDADNESYFPETQMTIRNLEQTIEYINCKKSKIRLIRQGIEKIVEHIYWDGWTDMSVPFGNSELVFSYLVEEAIRMSNAEQFYLVHCMAGVGRTGTFGTVIEAVRYLRKYQQLSIFMILDYVRRQRMHSVETFEQYKFIYKYLSKEKL